MKLYNRENQHHGVNIISQSDTTLLNDRRVLANMLNSEERWILKQSYFDSVQKQQIQPEMRRMLTTWMAEVCEDQQCEDVVLPLATVLLDNFLSVRPVYKGNLQLVGCVCLLVASKLRQCYNVSCDQLVYYTDYSVTVEQLLEWEMILLNELNWNVAAVTSNDFLDPLLSRVSEIEELPLLKLYARMLISLCSTDYSFAFQKPSLIAVASICVAGFDIGLKTNLVEVMNVNLQVLTSHTKESVSSCISSIKELFASSLTVSGHQPALPTNKRSPSSVHQPTKSSTNVPQAKCSPIQLETPTELLDMCNDRAFNSV